MSARPSTAYMSRLRRYRAAALLMLLVHVAGCATWQTLDRPYASTLPQTPEHGVRVTTSEGEQVVIQEPRIEGQVLSGRLLDEDRRRTEIPWSVQLSEVAEIAVTRTSTGARIAQMTVLLVLVGGGIFLYWLDNELNSG